MDRPRLPLHLHLVPWLLVPVVEIALDRSSFPRHGAGEIALEVAAFAALGAAQWRFAGEPWLRSLIWPGLLPLLASVGASGPVGNLLWLVFYVAGLVLLTTSLLRDLAAKVHVGPLAASLLAVASVLGARALDLRSAFADTSARFGGKGGQVAARLSEELFGGSRAASAGRSDGPPVVIVSVDTLRADAARTMTSWERLAARGAWWESAMSTASWTMPAVASLQTGVLPAVHGATCLVDSHCQGLVDDVRTLAEDLRDAGYVTAAVTANPWIGSATGLDRGFVHFRDMAGIPPYRMLFTGYADGPHPQDAKVLIDAAVAWLEQEAPDRGFYLWIHLLGPHMPYLHSDSAYMQTIEGARLRTGAPPSAELRTALRAAYDAEVAYNDREIARLLDVLEARGILDTGIVVLTSDHGEEFWEHGGVEHGHAHVKEVTEVPLVVVAPGLSAGPRDGTASLVDVASTVRAALGLEARGLDLREPLPPDRIATAWGNLYVRQQRSARDAAARVIVTEGPDGDVLDLDRYDRLADPDERHAHVPVDGDPVLEAALRAHGPSQGKQVKLGGEALKALGYVVE